jgi:hypothetical protein
MSATVLDAKLKLPKVDEEVLSRLMSMAVVDDVASTQIPQELNLVLSSLHPEFYNAGLYATLGVCEHTDDSAPCDITLGVVLSGDHVLYEEGGRQVGELVEGSIFILHNKRPHAAHARNVNNVKSLVFIACDLNVKDEDFDTVCEEIYLKL